MSSSAAKLVGHLLIGAALGGVVSAAVAATVTVPYDPTSRMVMLAYIILGASISAYLAGDLG